LREREMLRVVLFALVCLASVALAVIYGADSRQEEYQVDQFTAPMGRGSGAFISRQFVNSGFYPIVGKQFNLCPNADPFENQTSLAECSGFLIGPDLVATAGSCVLDQVSQNSLCSNLAFVLNYVNYGPLSYYDVFAAGEVANCKRVINGSTPLYRSAVVNITTGASGPVEINKPNWAIVQIDKSFPGAYYDRFRSFKHLHLNERVITIGHPLGAPRKYDTTGRIWAIDGGLTGRGMKLFTSSDSFKGSEGGPVLDTDGRVIGIQSGTVNPDFIPRDFIPCNIEQRCPFGITEDDADCLEGEQVTSLCYLAPFLPNGTIEPCSTAGGSWRNLPPGVNENINFPGRIKKRSVPIN